jgi:hypothetical protein
MQLFDLFVFGLVGSCLFGDLIVKKTDIRLVLSGHDLLFRLNLVEGLMQVFDLLIIHILRRLNSIHQMLNPRLPLLQPINIIRLNPLQLFMLRL